MLNGKKRFTLLVSLTVAVLLPLSLGTSMAKAKNQDASLGRAGNWKLGTQGAPSIEACRKRVAANSQDADAQNDLGWALRQNGDEKGAEAALRQSIKLNPASAYPHSNLSVVLMDTNHPDDALAEAARAVALDDKQPIFHVVLGNALTATGDRKKAIEEYRIALKMRPDYENAMYNLGRVLNEDGQNAEAKVTLSEALELDPKDERVLKLLDQILQ
jgi:Flp pilus assembly protein TadD